MTNYLIDTHTLLWHLEDSKLLPEPIKQLVESPTNKISISIASLWEIAIKVNIGKLKLITPYHNLQIDLLRVGIRIVPINFTHLQTYLTLAPHHKDPFDRMLIAQAITENFVIIGSDEIFDKYPVMRIW
jgi:PIN domain nuclease of toxin-antitoxin system